MMNSTRGAVRRSMLVLVAVISFAAVPASSESNLRRYVDPVAEQAMEAAEFDPTTPAEVTETPTSLAPTATCLSTVATVLPRDTTFSQFARAPSTRYRGARGVYLLTAAELAANGLPNGASLGSIGWDYATAPGVAGSGTLVIYLQNTVDATFLKSTSFASAIASMTIVHNAVTTLPAAAGTFDVPFSGGSPFSYTGSGLYVAFEWTYAVGTLSTTAQVATNVTLPNGIEGSQTTAAPPSSDTLSASNFRPETRLASDGALCDDGNPCTSGETCRAGGCLPPVSFAQPAGSPVPVGTGPSSVAAGDLNNDGRIDLAVANRNSNNVSILLGNGSGGFTGSLVATGGNGPIFVTTGYVNGDGMLDLAVANFNANNVAILLGDGAGGFTGSLVTVGTGPVSVAAGHMNGTAGGLDLAVVDQNSNDVTILLGDGSGGFTGSPVAVGTLPASVAAGDVNGDGRLDLAVANFNSNNVTILLGNGAGAFSAAVGSPVLVGSGPISVAVADVNDDGKLDLAVANFNSNNVTILLGNGTGGFTGSPVTVGANPISVAAGDMNGDAKFDLAAANFGGDSVTILLGNGLGGFSEAAISPVAVGTGPRSVAVEDLNADGKPDLAVANRTSNDITILLNTRIGPTPVKFCNTASIVIPAASTSGPASLYPSPITVSGSRSTICTVTVDLRGVTHTFPADIDILLARDSGGIPNALIMSDVGTSTDVINLNLTLADIAVSGLPNLNALASGTFKPTNFGAGDTFPVPAPAPSGGSALSVFTGTNPNGLWNLWVVDDASADTGSMSGGWCLNVTAPCGADADCDDGNVCTEDTCNLVTGECVHTNAAGACNDGNACTFGDVCTAGTCGGTTITCTSDVCATRACNGTSTCTVTPLPDGPACDDGNPCTADETCRSGICLPPASFGQFAGSPVAVGTNPISLAARDWSGDGNIDLAVANQSSNDVTILLGNGGGSFSPAAVSPVAVGTNPVSVAAGEWNGDGRFDLAVANASSSTVTILLGDGSGGFSPAAGSPVAVGANPRSIAVGDVNGDARLDLAVANRFSDNVTILLGNGSGGFSPAAGSPAAVGASPYSIVAGDWNGDGKLDLAVANNGSNGVTILLGDGVGGFGAAAGSPVAVGSNPESIAAGDVNGDGKLDLAVANASSNTVTILLGDGAGGFIQAAGSPVAVGTNPASVAMVEVSGDGKRDLAVANAGSNTVTILLGNGAGGFIPAGGSPMAAGSVPVAITVADVFRDGNSDLVIANFSANNVTILINITAFNDGFACNDGNACTTGDLCANGSCRPTTGSLNCNDNSTCTADSCSPATGCVHTNTAIANDASVDYVISLGSLPQSLVGPQTVQAVITNRGNAALSNLQVTLNVTGAQTFSNTKTVASLPACGGQTVTFDPFTLSTLGSDAVTVSIPADPVATNNTKSRPLNATDILYSYKHPGTTADGGVGFNGVGEIVAKFTTTAAAKIAAVNLEFFAVTGTAYRVAIYPDSGSGTPGLVPLYADATDRFVAVAGPVSIALPTPVAVGPGTFFAGIQQTNTTNARISMDTETPIRPGAFYSAGHPVSAWTDLASFGISFKVNIGVTLVQCVTAAECNDANLCTTDSCNPANGQCVHTNNTNPCDDGNACTVGDICGGGGCNPGAPAPAPSEPGGVFVGRPTKNDLAWSAAANATSYDVLRGGLIALPVGPGGGDETCLGNVMTLTTADTFVPVVGTGAWYLVRGANACNTGGSYGNQGFHGTPGVSRVSTTCP